MPSALDEQLAQLDQTIRDTAENATTVDEIQTAFSHFFGRKGAFTKLMTQLKDASPEERPVLGKTLNIARGKLEAVLNDRREALEKVDLDQSLMSGWLDVSESPRRRHPAALHPITIITNQILRIFRQMGFTPVEAPELEDEYHNFQALNIPDDHPARDEQDSFYVSPVRLLRSQTSTAQIRTMQRIKPPLAIVHAGRVFRRETIDATHSHTFYQAEGLMLDRGITMAHLKGTLFEFARLLYGPKAKLRMRPDYFPFTEPSGEFAAYTGDRWLELGGCGLVDPYVLEEVGIDPDEYSGFAFGLGIDRLVMIKYGIPDIRLLYENDMRLLRQFVGQR